jgi:hypothetical protein
MCNRQIEYDKAGKVLDDFMVSTSELLPTHKNMQIVGGSERFETLKPDFFAISDLRVGFDSRP